MIQSRDLVVFVLIVLFLLMAILVTLLIKNDSAFSLTDGVSFFSSQSTASTTFVAVDTTVKTNRNDTISRLRALLQGDDVELANNPSVESVIEEITVDVQEGQGGALTEGVDRCSDVDDAALYARSWPLSDVSIAVADGVRSVVYASTETISVDITSTSSASTTQNVLPTTLLSMRAFPVVQTTTSCLPSEIIGVTVEGSLLFNADAQAYITKGPETLIGYARDGFPIYGAYDGVVDSCGGYQHMQGYRYSISSVRPYVLGCYVGSPSTFVGG